MASENFEIKLSLKDTETVKRGLESLGSSGQRALAKLEAATTPASRGLQLLDQASGAVQGGMSELASRSGAAGEALSSLGKGGLAAAAALGAIALAIGTAIQAARAATDHFGNIADAAERAGTSAENFQTLSRVAEASASSSEELGKALETLRLKIDGAAGGSKQLQETFQRAGISMQFLQQHGGDTAAIFNELSKNGVSASDAVELLGRGGKGLLPTLNELNGTLSATKGELLDTSKIASEQVVAAFDKLADDSVARLNESFAKWSGLLLDVASGLDRTSRAGHGLLDIAANLLSALKGIEEGAFRAGDRLQYALSQRAAWESPEGMRAALRQGLGISPDIRTASGDTATTGDAAKGGLSNLAVSARSRLDKMGIALDRPIQAPASSGGRRSGSTREPNLGLEMSKPFGDRTLLSTGGGLEKVTTTEIEPSYAFKQHSAEADDFYKRLDDITKKTGEANDESAKWFDQLQLNTDLISTTSSTLSGMFTEAFMGERKLADVLAEIPGLITKIIMQKLIELAITLAIQAATGGAGGAGAGIGGAIAGLFSGGSGAAAGGGYQMGGMSTTPIVTSARGNAFVGGNVIPFARGGIVDRPTLFPMARGAGLMGEAGPEAVMPLKRTASGDLGVRAQTPPMQVVINNYSDADVKQREERGADGSTRLILDLVKREVAADISRPGTQLNKAVGSANSPVRGR